MPFKIAWVEEVDNFYLEYGSSLLSAILWESFVCITETSAGRWNRDISENFNYCYIGKGLQKFSLIVLIACAIGCLTVLKWEAICGQLL